MKRGVAVPITPSVLSWAIRESGYSEVEVASKVKVNLQVLESWERGAGQPTLTLFKKLTSILKRPAAAFFLPESPKSIIPPVEFRHPWDTERSLLNPLELRYLREASRLQRILSWVIQELGGERLAFPKVSVGSNTEQVAATIRQNLRIKDDQKIKWRSSSEALEYWRSTLEDYGILVLLLPLGKASCSGFSLWNDFAPLITVNTRWNNEARIFTLFHEYAHLLSRTNSACIESGARLLRKDGDQIERWCERLAAAVVLPWDEAVTFLRKECNWTTGEVITNLNVVRRLAHYFKVSLRATTLRLIEKGIATWDLYAEIPLWSDDKPKGGGGGGRHRLQIREDQYGRRVTNLFLDAIKKDVMNTTDVINYLDVPYADLEGWRRHQGNKP